jgi:mannose-6-phosphate isomerase-like protein (cupin superfamily)
VNIVIGEFELMMRRDFFALSVAMASSGFRFGLEAPNQSSNPAPLRQAVLVRFGSTRKLDGTTERAPSPSGMFDTQVVRSTDSEGRLAIYLFPAGEHHAYGGAPLHVHHEQDEWIYVIAGEFVAEVGGNRMRLKPGDSLLMPMSIPHRWSVAQLTHCGAIHLYSPAGLMEVDWASVARDEDAKNLEARKAEFERHGLTLLGKSLTREEIDSTS